eukprot:TRINITY_DN8151_c0_g1_i3.p1 TRINITY_DN8151_c0_g1~~TRINITY_DN8151_c0_g1_i3.p1  ORF type:complete len:114 (+),score=13.58 TRINITY_DN8151_c0_g1_i3:76-417(+)
MLFHLIYLVLFLEASTVASNADCPSHQCHTCALNGTCVCEQAFSVPRDETQPRRLDIGSKHWTLTMKVQVNKRFSGGFLFSKMHDDIQVDGETGRTPKLDKLLKALQSDSNNP